MAKRQGHLARYEQVFEHLLRTNKVLYIAIDETKRPLYKDRTIKNFDFIVSSFNGTFMIDIEGKQFPYVRAGKPVYWENWVHEDDISGVMEWSSHFTAFRPLLVYPYLLTTSGTKDQFADFCSFKGYDYGVIAIELSTYYTAAVVRSPKWKAIYVPRDKFKQLSKPVSHFIPELQKKW